MTIASGRSVEKITEVEYWQQFFLMRFKSHRWYLEWLIVASPVDVLTLNHRYWARMAVPFNNSIYSALTAIISAIMVVGIVIQVSALLVFTRKSFREIKLTALFINVTVANATILIFECPLLMVSSTQRTLWPENGIICNMRGFLCGAASINTIITFQFLVTKTMALVKNVSPSSFLGEIMLKESTMIAISWLYSMLCMLPPLLGWSSIHVDPSGLSCALDWWTQTSENIAYLVVLTIFAFCLPVSYLAYKLVSLWFYFANKQPSASDVVNRNREMYRFVDKSVVPLV